MIGPSPILLDSVANDGGQWNMFVAIVNKHGLVPKAFMPETHSSSNTARMNSVLRNLLRQGAKSVREASPPGRRRGASREGGHPEGHLPGAVHPPRDATGALRLAVDGQGPGVSP